jgi:hypothetical protein
VPYRIAARDEEVWSKLREEAARAHLTAESRFRKRAKVVYAIAALVIASAGVMMLLAVRLDYAHRTRDPGAGMCGPGLITCPENETCVFDDYSHVFPIGYCEQSCQRKFQSCSRTSTPRACMFTEEEPETLACVRVYGSGLR